MIVKLCVFEKSLSCAFFNPLLGEKLLKTRYFELQKKFNNR